MIVGTVKIPTYLARVAKIIQFLILNKLAIYNAILDTPWLHAMKAVASTYHQCLKFPTPYGIYTLRGNQAIARSCYINKCKLRSANQACVISSQGPTADLIVQKTKPKQETITQVCIDELRPKRQISIGAELDPKIPDTLVHFLKQHSSTFAWSIEDRSIHRSPVTSSTSTRLTNRSNRSAENLDQKRHKPLMRLTITKGRLNHKGQIPRLSWKTPWSLKRRTANKEFMSTSPTSIKRAPKTVSLWIDRLVEATAGNELLSFMDAFFGYNQILMHPQDQEKTSFITDHDIYCYKVMPFGLKNAGATYQRLVNRMFASQLGRTMEVYINDMLVKSLVATDNVGHLRTCFDIRDGRKFNPTKCTFGVTSGEFLGYIVTQRGIEANPKQIASILELPSPTTKREVQRLTGRIAVLNRFISRSTDKCLLFYTLIRGNKHLEWNQKCEEAFTKIKKYLSTPPVLSKPETGETLYLYIAISEYAVSSVLVREDRGEQKPIFYISKSLHGSEYRYPTLEKFAFTVVISARKLRPYFQSHAIVVLTDHPLRTFLHGPNQSELVEANPAIQPWILHTDGSSPHKGSGIGIRLKSPNGEILEQSFHLGFPASNNEAKYEAVIVGLRLAKIIGIEHIHAYCDSQMDAYLKILKDLASEFSTFELTKIPRDENASADALAALATNSDPDLRRTIPVEAIERPSIELAPNNESNPDNESEGQHVPLDIEAEGDDEPEVWTLEIVGYIGNGTVLTDKWAARRLKARAA
ncbi:uncharacterized protein LOC112089807 [Eutrema salsugineum]|uniref:uncharacterized protein LOC112089807 n=1 Tax=Eutrema salsugineum TaxID=72664 RepID=UPI000CECED84|nr:uncharacterized protein LOC112089807 [Eutrema salsugineum]